MVTFAKLMDGTWGIRGGGLVPGASVTVRKRSGEARRVTVGQVVWTGKDRRTGQSISLARIGGHRSVMSRDRDSCCGYPCPVTGRKCTPSDPCHDCQ